MEKKLLRNTHAKPMGFAKAAFLLGTYMKICSKMNMGYIEYVLKGVSKKWETL